MPRRRLRLHPVRQLKRHRVAGADAALTQAARESASYEFDVGEGPLPGPYVGEDPELGVRSGFQAAGEKVAEGVACPPPSFS